MSSNAELQSDEVEALSAIYPDKLKFSDLETGNLEFEIRKDDTSLAILINIHLTPEYPTQGPPSFQVCAKNLVLDIRFNTLFFISCQLPF